MASGAWRVLLLVSVAAALTPARGLSHREAVNLALDTYNRGSDVDRAFRVFGSVPRPRPAPSPTTIPLNFTVKETVCFKREKFDLDQCDFRDRGLVRDCTGFVSTAQRPPTVTISCEGVSVPAPVGKWAGPGRAGHDPAGARTGPDEPGRAPARAGPPLPGGIRAGAEPPEQRRRSVFSAFFPQPIRTKRFLFSLIRATFSIGRAVSATVRGLRYRFRRNKRRRG
uniref:Uncharacterized protein n=1 Tax=Ornithorhynchus anatinus TaxID=9258 RepID=F7ARW0_ORNAN